MLAGLLYSVATALDLTTTTVALKLGLHEGNPIVAPFINAYGIVPQIGVSAILCAVLWWYAARGGRKLVYVLALLRWTVVASNLMLVMQANHFAGSIN